MEFKKKKKKLIEKAPGLEEFTYIILHIFEIFLTRLS
jgi:hypothetical protein